MLSTSPRALIHLGLHKTASTSLQQIWKSMPEVSLMSYEFVRRLTDLLHDAVTREVPFDLSALKDEPMFQSQGEGANPWQIFSSEGLSVFRWLKTPPDTLARTYLDRKVELFSLLSPEAHILIIVREPQAWIRSMYMQYLQTGGTATYRRFLLIHGKDLGAILRLDQLKAPWAARYGADRVHILPFELFRDDPARFFSEIESRTGLPVPDPALLTTRQNVSISATEGEFMRRTNGLFALFMKSGSMDDISREALRKLAPQIASTIRFELQNNKRSQLTRAAPKVVQPPMHIPLPADLIRFLRDDFLPMLGRETGDLSGYLEAYRAANA